jgi:hypothetical protein
MAAAKVGELIFWEINNVIIYQFLPYIKERTKEKLGETDSTAYWNPLYCSSLFCICNFSEGL